MTKTPVSRLKAQSFGPFSTIDVEFSDTLTVVIGDNSTGKSHLLKLLYTCTDSLVNTPSLTKKDLSDTLAAKLQGVFRPESLGRLTRRAVGRTSAQVEVEYKGIANPLSFSFSSHAKTNLALERVPTSRPAKQPVFLPPHELLTLGAPFVSLYSQYETSFEETWRDTVELLLRPALRGPRGHSANQLLEPFSEILEGGTVVEEQGSFYVKQPGVGKLEAPLVAEGQRKLAMIVRLIANGVIAEGGYLFWDEPEANLNPASQRAVVHALISLAKAGMQIVVATHSMFLLRELEMSAADMSPRYISLTRGEKGADDTSAVGVVAESSPDLEGLHVNAALDAEAEQANRYLSW